MIHIALKTSEKSDADVFCVNLGKYIHRYCKEYKTKLISKN